MQSQERKDIDDFHLNVIAKISFRFEEEKRHDFTCFASKRKRIKTGSENEREISEMKRKNRSEM